MLEIRQLGRYNVPRYPQGGDYSDAPRPLLIVVKTATTSIVLAVLLESCIGIHGKMPAPELMSEVDARDAITRAFSSRQMSVVSDQVLTVRINESDSAVVKLDGYDATKRVGFEYVSLEDKDKLSQAVQHRLNNAKYTEPPHVLIIDANDTAYKTDTYLQQVVASFLDSLKAHGMI